MLKQFIIFILEVQAKRLLLKYKPRIVAVTGSVGKTSTKLAIATVLGQRYRVLAQYGSYNTPIGLPMAIFNMAMPGNLRSLWAWVKIFYERQRRLREPYPYDVLVLELGADKLGDIGYFKKYVRPYVAVVTGVAAEHMASFGTIENIAKEELSVVSFAASSLINRDDIEGKYANILPTGIDISTYGTSGVAEYNVRVDDYKPGQGYNCTFLSPGNKELKVKLGVVGEHSLRAVAAAGAVGLKFGLAMPEIRTGLQAIRPVQGRMNLLRGLNNSLLIDDTYNSSPLAAIAALQALYLFPASQKIAILGSMNELGNFSPEAHKQVGEACNAGMLDWVITVGADAQRYLAPAAIGKGCQVRSFLSPYEAGAFAHQILQRGAVVLAKGSQNGVFTEEALKILLHSTEEESQLVRQSPSWMAIKQKQFEIPVVGPK